MPTVITITLPPNLDAVLASLTAVQGGAVNVKAGMDLAPRLTRWLIDNSQFIAGSGPFSRGWLATPNAVGISVTNNFGPALFIEKPTRPHEIRPVRALALAWMPGRGPFSAVFVKASTKAAAGTVFAKVVHHPGTGGKGVFPLVIDMHNEDILQALSDAATAILAPDQAKVIDA